VLAGTALADPQHVDEKDWAYGDTGTTAVVPEAEPNDVCPGQAIACGDEVNPAFLAPADQDWYYFTANAGEEVTIGTDAIPGGVSADTYLELYFGCGTTAIATNDDGGPGLYSLISNFPIATSGEYQIKVRGFSGTSTGDYLMFLTCETPPPPPENDVCNDNYVIDRCTTGTLDGDTSNYRNDYTTGSPSCTGFTANGNDAVYRMDLNAGDVVDLVYTQLLTDTSFYIITDCADAPNSCVIGADDTLTGEPEVINWVVGATGTYWLILDAWTSEAGGPWILDYAIECPPTPTENSSWGQLKTNFR
jgi:hypothetical protein